MPVFAYNVIENMALCVKRCNHRDPVITCSSFLPVLQCLFVIKLQVFLFGCRYYIVWIAPSQKSPLSFINLRTEGHVLTTVAPYCHHFTKWNGKYLGPWM